MTFKFFHKWASREGKTHTSIAPSGTSDKRRWEPSRLRSSGPHHIPKTPPPAFQEAFKGGTSQPHKKPLWKQLRDTGTIQVPTARGHQKSPHSRRLHFPRPLPIPFPQSICSSIYGGHHQGGVSFGRRKVTKGHHQKPCTLHGICNRLQAKIHFPHSRAAGKYQN